MPLPVTTGVLVFTRIGPTPHEFQVDVPMALVDAHLEMRHTYGDARYVARTRATVTDPTTGMDRILDPFDVPCRLHPESCP